MDNHKHQLQNSIDAIKLNKKYNRKIVFTNGCFDILHVGHIRYLSQAKSLGDILVVGINTDESVKDAKKFLKKNPANFLVVRDAEFKAVETYEPKGYPIGYLVDKSGEIVEIEMSVPEYDKLKAKIEALL